MISKTNLFNCPFCGRRDLEIIKVNTEDNQKYFLAFTIQCRDCLARGPLTAKIAWAETKESATELWNSRPHLPYTPSYEHQT